MPLQVYKFDSFVLDLDRGTLLGADGRERPLRPKSFALLQLFVENAGRLLSRDDIMNAVWPDVVVGDDSLTQCVHEVRRALGGPGQRLLSTVQRRGYRFTSPVLRIEPEVSSAPSNDRAEWTSGADPEPVTDIRSSPEAQLSSLKSGPESLPEGPPTVSEEVPASVRLQPAAERRHLTVLFCDLVGSTELSEKLDPEDFGSIISIYREHCAAAIVQAGGHIESYPGDGIVALFGYPQAREDAAERSVRAGLAIVEATQHLHADLALQVRIGIATGLVVNDPTSQTLEGRSSVGQPLNLAARLLAVAEPTTVVIAESTRRLVGSLFALEDLGVRSLKGFAAPMQAWRVTGDGVAESRFRALRGTDLIPLVGREHELTMLLDRWEQASDGEGQVVLIVGEPGIGKSRLVQALRDRLTASSHIYVGCYCSAHRMDSPLQPIIAYLERAANFAHDEDPGQRLTKLETLLARVNKETKELVPLIAPLLSISSEGRYSAPRISPQLQREQTLTTLVDQLVRLSSRRTVLLVCEDVHWADATSLELLRLVIDRVQILPVLALITFRPGFVPTWPSLSHVTGLMLNRLSRRRCDQIIAAMTPVKSMPKPIVERILAYADGVPLFVEELTKQVLEAELLRKEEDHSELVGPLSPVAIPTTLQDSLMARLDRLGPAKEIAQIASVIGRESPRELLAAVVPQDADLPDGLHRLALAELVFRRGTEPQITYVFKHVLVRDAAYASLLSARRRELHCTIAQTLEEHFTHVAEGEPDVLAHHWAEAGAAEKAAEYRRKAGEKALTHSAITEAIAQLLLGKSLLQNLPEGEGRWRRELELQIPMGAALSAANGMAAEETVKAYERAHELCDLLGEEQRRIPVLLGLWGSYNARDELGLAHRAAAQLLQSAEQRQNETASVLGHRALGATLFQIGEFASAKTHLQRLLELDSTRAGIFSVALPYDPFISGRAWLSLTLSVLGYCDQALVQAAKALADAEHLQHQNTQALVLSLRCSLGQYLRDHQAVERHAKALLALAVERGFAYWVGLATYFQGWARAGTTDVSAGIAEMRRGLAACQTTGAQAYVPYNLALLADTCRIAGDPLLGRELLNEALAQLDQTEARYCESELLCIDGELRLSMPQADLPEAVRLFRRAIEIARRKNARTTELRATTHLAQLMADSGDRREAYNLLAPAYAWFTEGFDTRYLVDAKALLHELAKEAT